MVSFGALAYLKLHEHLGRDFTDLGDGQPSLDMEFLEEVLLFVGNEYDDVLSPYHPKTIETKILLADTFTELNRGEDAQNLCQKLRNLRASPVPAIQCFYFFLALLRQRNYHRAGLAKSVILSFCECFLLAVSPLFFLSSVSSSPYPRFIFS